MHRDLKRYQVLEGMMEMTACYFHQVSADDGACIRRLPEDTRGEGERE